MINRTPTCYTINMLIIMIYKFCQVNTNNSRLINIVVINITQCRRIRKCRCNEANGVEEESSPSWTESSAYYEG